MAVRKHPVSGEPILYAPERAGRPNAFERTSEEVCPFCPGNESLTPPEIARTGDPWRVRVFPNKYPAVAGHEVIVESNRHDATFHSIDNAAEVMSMYISSYRPTARAASVPLFPPSAPPPCAPDTPTAPRTLQPPLRSSPASSGLVRAHTGL